MAECAPLHSSEHSTRHDLDGAHGVPCLVSRCAATGAAARSRSPTPLSAHPTTQVSQAEREAEAALLELEIGPEDSVSVACMQRDGDGSARTPPERRLPHHPPPPAHAPASEGARRGAESGVRQETPVVLEAADGTRHEMAADLDGVASAAELQQGLRQAYTEISRDYPRSPEITRGHPRACGRRTQTCSARCCRRGRCGCTRGCSTAALCR